jgi:hypothetical protein
MSISVQNSYKKRTENLDKVIILKSLSNKIKQWNELTEEELTYIGLFMGKIFDINNKTFQIRITGNIYSYCFVADNQSTEIIKKINLNLNRHVRCNFIKSNYFYLTTRKCQKDNVTAIITLYKLYETSYCTCCFKGVNFSIKFLEINEEIKL